jgi:hypothetical protein
MFKIDPAALVEVEEIMKRIRAAKRLPYGHPKKEP